LKRLDPPDRVNRWLPTGRWPFPLPWPGCLSRLPARATITGRRQLTAVSKRMKKPVVRAEEFEVVDEIGDVRLRIGLGNDDSTGLPIGFMDEQKAPTWTMR